MKNPLVYITCMILVSLASCFKEDVQIPPHEQGDVEVGYVEMGSDYREQVFFDLNSNRAVTVNPLSNWDLCFENAPDGWHIRLNTARFMYAGNTHDTAFHQVNSAAGLDMTFDASSGNPDSTAIGTWYRIQGDTTVSLNEVYVIDRGSDASGKAGGFKKVQFDFSGDAYRIRYASLDNQEENASLVPKNDTTSYTYFSFREGIVPVSPGKEDWSLLFTRYTTMLVTNEGEDYPYLVTGVLLNPAGVAAARDSSRNFDAITLADTLDLRLSSQQDMIGYTWKYYDFDAGLYTVIPEFHYIIRDRDGFYYKLRFIDFYNDTGEKGFPEFEFVRL